MKSFHGLNLLMGFRFYQEYADVCLFSPPLPEKKQQTTSWCLLSVSFFSVKQIKRRNDQKTLWFFKLSSIGPTSYMGICMGI